MRKALRTLPRYLGASLALALLLAQLMVIPVYAAIADPDTIAITSVDAYKHCLEDDDMLVIVGYNLQYATNPDDSIEYTYLSRMMDGAAEVASITPYSYRNKGYDYGIFSFYFTAAEVAGGISWNSDYTIRFEGNPTLEWTDDPPLVTWELETDDDSWHDTATQGATEAILKTRILWLADNLADRWQTTLTEEIAGGTVLNSAGQQYFSNSIDNLRTLVPSIFPTQTQEIVFVEQEHTTTYQDILKSRTAGTILGRAQTSIGNLLGIDDTMAGAAMWFGAMALLIWGIVMGTGQTKTVGFILLPMVILGNLTGLLSLTFTMILGFLSVIAAGYILFYSKASA